jgi:hypothetical protein
MNQKNKKTDISRREFFKRALKKTGYIIPIVMVFKAGSIDSWAESYKKRNNKKSGDRCKGFFKQIFDPSCW